MTQMTKLKFLSDNHIVKNLSILEIRLLNEGIKESAKLNHLPLSTDEPFWVKLSPQELDPSDQFRPNILFLFFETRESWIFSSLIWKNTFISSVCQENQFKWGELFATLHEFLWDCCVDLSWKMQNYQAFKKGQTSSCLKFRLNFQLVKFAEGRNCFCNKWKIFQDWSLGIRVWQRLALKIRKWKGQSAWRAQFEPKNK